MTLSCPYLLCLSLFRFASELVNFTLLLTCVAFGFIFVSPFCDVGEESRSLSVRYEKIEFLFSLFHVYFRDMLR